MEAVAYFLDAENIDVRREGIVDRPPQRFRRQRRVNVEVRDLRERVHAGVGPA
jgi:hypothetical protein